MFSLIGTLFTSIISGGATGIFGVAVQRYFDLKNKDRDIQLESMRQGHEINMRKVDLEIMQKESEAKVSVAKIDAASAEAVADSQSFAASFADPKPYSDDVVATRGQGWVLILLDVVRGLVRPTLTVYLCILTSLVYFQAYNLLKAEGVAMDVSQAMRLIEMVVGTILYLTTTCVLWWFGTRNKQKPPKIRP
jgi:hypothetical protein